MFRKTLIASALLCIGVPGAYAASKPAAAHLPSLTAGQIVARNIKARGGIAAWRKVKTLSMSGMMDVGGNSNAQLPFVMRLKRPRKMEFELTFNGQVARQVFDGMHGWKLRPFLNRTDVEPYTPEEMKKAREMQGLEGPLMNYAAKGTKVAVDGVEPVDGHNAYRLKLTLKDKQVRHLWVDGRSFLEIKLEGYPRTLDGKPHKVATYFRDFRSVRGLKMPFVYETAVEGVKATHKMTIDKVTVNPALSDSLFSKPSPVIVSNQLKAKIGDTEGVQTGKLNAPGMPDRK